MVRNVAVWSLIVVGALVAGPANAYRPPARLLLQKSMERQAERGTKTLRVDAETHVGHAALVKGAERMPEVEAAGAEIEEGQAHIDRGRGRRTGRSISSCARPSPGML